MSISSTRSNDLRFGYNESSDSQVKTDLNQTAKTNVTGAESGKPSTAQPATQSQSAKDSRSSNGASEARFFGDFQAYKLQNSLKSATTPTPTVQTIKPTATVDQKTVENYVKNFNGDITALGKDLAGKLNSNRPEDVALVRGALIFINNSKSPEAAATLAKNVIDGVADNGVLKKLALSSEGSRTLSLARAYLNNNSQANGAQIERINTAQTQVRNEQASSEQKLLNLSDKVKTAAASISPIKARKLSDNEIPKNGNKEIRYELPAKGEGYVSYKINDTKKNYEQSDGVKPELVGTRLPDHVGTKDTIERLLTLSKEWNKLHPDRPIQVGDLSLPGGVDTPDHHTHEDGRAIDIRPFRNDGKVDGLTYSNTKDYNQDLTIEFVQFVLNKYPNTKFYFNDPVVREKFPKIVEKEDKHNDHLHIIFSPTDDRK